MAKKKKKKSTASSGGGGQVGEMESLAQQQLSANQQMFNLDLDQRKREADMANAQFIAEQMRLRMEAEIRSRGYLVQPVRDSMGNWTGEFTAMLDGQGQPIPSFDAARQAREIALREAEFELTKTRAERDYGLTYQDQQFRQAMETRQQAWTEQYQRAQTMLAEGDLTGYYNGMATLDRQKWEADASGYMPDGQSTLARQQAEWNTILNAPRGPADYYAYMQRMRGIAGSGNAPGVISQFVNGGQLASVTGDPNSMPRPTTNTELAMGLVYGQPRPGIGPNAQPRPSMVANMMPGGWEAGQAPYMLPGGGTITPPGVTPPGAPGAPGAPGSVPQYPWQAPPPGGWGATPSAPAAPTVPMNPGGLAQAIYGVGLQGVGSFNIDQMSQGDLDSFFNLLKQGGSSVNDPRIVQIMDAAKANGYQIGAWEQWFKEKPPHERYNNEWRPEWDQLLNPTPTPAPGQPPSPGTPPPPPELGGGGGHNPYPPSPGTPPPPPGSGGWGGYDPYPPRPSPSSPPGGYGGYTPYPGRSGTQPSARTTMDWGRMTPDTMTRALQQEQSYPGSTFLSSYQGFDWSRATPEYMTRVLQQEQSMPGSSFLSYDPSSAPRAPSASTPMPGMGSTYPGRSGTQPSARTPIDFGSMFGNAGPYGGIMGGQDAARTPIDFGSMFGNAGPYGGIMGGQNAARQGGPVASMFGQTDPFQRDSGQSSAFDRWSQSQQRQRQGGYGVLPGEPNPRGGYPQRPPSGPYGYSSQQQQANAATSRMFANIFGTGTSNTKSTQPDTAGQYGGIMGGQNAARTPIDFGSMFGNAGPYGGIMGGQDVKRGGMTDPFSSEPGPYGGQQQTQAQQPQYTGARNWSRQQFRKLSPTEQQFTLGWNAEENGETMEDAKWLMDRSAPNYRRGRQAQYAGIS